MLKKLIAISMATVMMLSFTACQQNNTTSKDDAASKEDNTSQVEDNSAVEIGEGETSFVFEVKDDAGEISYTATVNTDKEFVAEALVENGLVEGDNGEFGLYIKTVNGVTVDYDTDGRYWAFYVNGEYAMESVSQTKIVEGETYMLANEK